MMCRQLVLICILLTVYINSYSINLSKNNADEFVYLKASEVNLRSGPDARHPIKWVIKSRGEPMKVLERFYQWVHVRNIEGFEGWIQMPLLSNKRKYGVVINTNKKPVLAYATNSVNSRKIVRLQPGVRVGVSKCNDTGWCKISINEFKAWINKHNLWGV